MAFLRHASARESLNQSHDVLDKRVAGTTDGLLRALNMIDGLVKPKRFELHTASLRQFASQDSDGRRHMVRNEDDTPIDEISEWQITGVVGNRLINVVATRIFHTHRDNRSGSVDQYLNGKPHFRPEYGGPTIDDLYQANKGYEQFEGAKSFGLYKQNHQGKLIETYH